jgi:hypothetical protein
VLAIGAGEIHALFIIFTAYQGGTWIDSSPGVYVPAYLMLGLVFGISLSFFVPSIDAALLRNQLIVRAVIVIIIFAFSSVTALLVAYQMAFESLYFRLDAAIFLLISVLYPIFFLAVILKEQTRKPISKKEEHRWTLNYPII